jgi:hypothetical protein
MKTPQTDAPNFEHKTPNVKLKLETDIRSAQEDELKTKLYEMVDKYLDNGGPAECVLMARKDLVRNAQRFTHPTQEHELDTTLKTLWEQAQIWPAGEYSTELPRAQRIIQAEISKQREQAQQELLDGLEHVVRQTSASLLYGDRVWIDKTSLMGFINSKRTRGSK